MYQIIFTMRSCIDDNAACRTPPPPPPSSQDISADSDKAYNYHLMNSWCGNFALNFFLPAQKYMKIKKWNRKEMDIRLYLIYPDTVSAGISLCISFCPRTILERNKISMYT